MTIVPTARPAIPTVSRPAASAAAPTGTMPSVDPLKLLKKHKWVLGAALVAGMFVGTVTHYVMLRIYPIFSSSLTYECFAPQINIKDFKVAAPSEKELEKFMATQVQILLSDRIVDKTVSDPALEREAPKWARQFYRKGVIDTSKAAKELKKKLSAGVAGQSQFIQVRLWGNDPSEVTAVIKLLGRTYERDRRMVGTAETAEHKQFISQAIADTADAIAKKQRERQRILQDAEVDSLTERMSSAQMELEKTQTELVQIRVNIKAVSTMLERYEAEEKNPLGPKIDDDIRDFVDKDPGVSNLKSQVNLIEAELRAMKTRLDANHVDVRRLESRLDGTRQQLEDETKRLCTQEFFARLDRYRSSLQSLQAQEASLMKNAEESRQKAIETAQILSQVNDINDELENLTSSRSRLAEDLKQLEVLTSNTKQQTRILLFQDAQIPKAVTFPRLSIMLPAGALLFLALTAGVVLVLEIVDQRVKSPADIAMIPRTRVLGLVPHAAEDPSSPAKIETVFRDQPTGVLAESFRQLRGSILKRMHAGGHKSLVCMSGMPGSGATTVVINLAFSLAAAEQKVLVIDANFRRPSAHRVLGLAETPGLADVLSGAKPFAQAVQTGDQANLAFLCAGSHEHRLPERLGSAAMSTLLKEASTLFDIILIDVAPAMVAGDAMGLANKCDASMLVVRALGEKRGMVARLRNELSESRAEFIGVVVNAVRSAAGGYLKGNILAAHTYQLNGNANGKT
jgi:polysaccharide biosynthesis transport protein